MSEHTHGDMNIEDHEKTFSGFIHVVAWCAVAAFVVLILAALLNA